MGMDIYEIGMGRGGIVGLGVEGIMRMGTGCRIVGMGTGWNYEKGIGKRGDIENENGDMREI